jgi:hypothetical protein
LLYHREMLPKGQANVTQGADAGSGTLAVCGPGYGPGPNGACQDGALLIWAAISEARPTIAA